MSSTTSSLKRIDKVSSDNLTIGFDLLSNLTYMAVLAIGYLPREQILERCARQGLKTTVFFEYANLLARRLGFEYTQAFHMVSEHAKASNIKSLLLRFAASISSGESEREFIAQEATTEAERYANEYERGIENLRKWTDAYAAILISVTLIMVVSLVSTMLGSLNQYFIVIMALVLLVVTSTGMFVIYKVAPVEKINFDSPIVIPARRKKARMLALVLGPIGLVLGLVLGFQFGLLAGVSVAFLCVGAFLFPAGYHTWKDGSSVNQLDMDCPTFFRSLGNVAGSTGITLAESLKRIDKKAMGSLEPHIDRLSVRLNANLPVDDCWDMFRAEAGSELINRTSVMMVDGAEMGGSADQVGAICSSFALRVSQLRAKRQLTSSTFSFLTIPMHATMIFILVFVLGIITNFNSKLSLASTGLTVDSNAGIIVPDSLQLPPGLPLPAQGDLTAGLDIFGNQDIGLATLMIVVVVGVLTVANALTPKIAAGGSNLNVLSFLSIMCLISGGVLGIVPVVTSKIFAI